MKSLLLRIVLIRGTCQTTSIHKKSLLLLCLILTSITFLNAQIEVLPDGGLKIGDNSAAKIESGTSTTLQVKAPFVQLESTTSGNPAKILANTGLKVLAPEIILENASGSGLLNIQANAKVKVNVSDITFRNTDSLGFKIYKQNNNPYINTSSGSQTVSLITGGGTVVFPPLVPDEIYLTGLSSNNTNIGSSTVPISKIYAKYVYSLDGTVGMLSASDTRLKRNITKIPSVRNRIKSLNVVKYDFTKTLGGEDVSDNPVYMNRTGLLAQEVKDVFPDIVYYNPLDSVYALDYAGLIPYLIKSDQEQQDAVVSQQEVITAQKEIIDIMQNKMERQEQMITELQEQVALLQKQSPSKIETTNKTHKLFQNSPNPFNLSTRIEYVLSDNVSNAKLCIYDLNGKQLRCLILNTSKGASSVEIRASDLQAGIYLYTLIVDNMPLDTKRMILTE
jgi:hypothetical protein